MNPLRLDTVVADFADALQAVDLAGPVGRSRLREYKPGVGPLQEREAVRLASEWMAAANAVYDGIGPRRYPGSRQECDLVIPKQWAIEVKLARPFGDNGIEAEHWSENLLHPYRGNVSAVGDALKLASMDESLAKAVLIYGFEHTSARVPLEPAIRAFELIATQVAGVGLGKRVETLRTNLVHPTHAVVRIYAWEVLGDAS